MKDIAILTAAVLMPIAASAQGNNTGMGGNDEGGPSLMERIFKLEKKTDAFNVYFNYAASFQEMDDGDQWSSSFKNKQARIEIKGNITDKLSYRFRHRLNKGNQAQSEDNFAKATDILMVGYQFSPKFSIQAGKMCQNYGGFEFDENPMYIYQYSDFLDYSDNFMTGVNFSYKPHPTQELDLNITDTYNNSFSDENGADARSLDKGGHVRHLEKSNHPLTYIGLWMGNFFGNRLQTRWSYVFKTLARHSYTREVLIGEQLNLPRLQWYFDYMMADEDIDRQGVATAEAGAYLAERGATVLGGVHYNSFITKLNWQFAPQFNLMAKGGYETASAKHDETFKDYRKSWLYIASVEYYPVKHEDFRIFLAYVGRHYNYNDRVKAYDLKDYSTNRIELGFMYRIKVF